MSECGRKVDDRADEAGRDACAMQALIDMTKHGHRAMRLAGCYGLMFFVDRPEVVDALRTCERDRDPDVASAAALVRNCS